MKSIVRTPLEISMVIVSIAILILVLLPVFFRTSNSNTEVSTSDREVIGLRLGSTFSDSPSMLVDCNIGLKRPNKPVIGRTDF